MPHTLLDQHTVPTVVVMCVDFRFAKHLPAALEETFGVSDYDDIKLAGGAGNLTAFADERGQAVLDDLELAVNAHQVKKIVLLNHQGCGKYAAADCAFTDFDVELEFHAQELRLAGSEAAAQFPDSEILLGFVHVDENDQVRIEPIAWDR